MKIEIEFDVSAYEAQADAVVERVVGPALIDAVNATARAARIAAVTAMPAFIDRPTPFTLAGIGMLPASGNPDAPHGLEALVSVMPIQAQYMQYQILGGTRGPGDYATTAEGPLVPGPDARLDAYGNLPRDFVDDEVANGAVWVHLKLDEPPALVRHNPGGHTEILALIVHELHYDRPPFPFYDIVANAAIAAFPAAFEAALAARLPADG
ncbi:MULTISPECIES: hypothetical protein [Methylobacterium]|uniref:hypothetical protein n=1 Tax=Methylobacterium TaxID=407 RepID=UPI00272EA230|nr:hypothetical protein [Methylobacterium sp.]